MSRYIKEKNSKKQMQRVRDKKIIEEDPRHPPLSNAEKCWRYRERRRNAPTNSTSDCYLEITAAPDEAGPSTSAMQSCSEDYEMGLLIPTNKTRNASMRVERDTMTLQDTSASMKMALGKPPEMSTEITIKREIDINIEVEDHSLDLQIKTENVTCNNEKISLNEEVNIENNDHQYDNMPMELKQEVDFAFIPEKEITDETVEPLEDMKVESRQVDEEMEKETENRIVAITKTENIDFENGRVEVKQEILMEDDSLVSYDYPDFNDAGSMDSSDAAVLGNVETCLQVDGGSNSESVSTYDLKKMLKSRGESTNVVDKPTSGLRMLPPVSTQTTNVGDGKDMTFISVPSTSRQVGVSHVIKKKRRSRSPSIDIEPPKVIPQQDGKIVYSEEKQLMILQEEYEEPEDFLLSESDGEGCESFESKEIEKASSIGSGPIAPNPPTQVSPRSSYTYTPGPSWTRQRRQTSIPFTLSSGVTSPNFDQLTTPREYFNLLLTQNIIDLIVTETNVYADFLTAQNTLPKALIRKWKPLTQEDFLIFLGLLYHTGSFQLARISDYWSTDSVLFNFECFRRCMSRDRFIGILQSLHFRKNPNPGEPIPADRLRKIRPLVNLFHDNMDRLVIPTRDLCIDESMILWSGRLVFHQCMKRKSHPYAIKLYMLKEPSGLVLRFIVYTGSSDTEIDGRSNTDKIVHKLMCGKLDVGHSLYMDSFYNNVNLVRELLRRKTYVTGTLRTNQKGNPPIVTSFKPKKGEVVDLYDEENVCVLKWKDRKEVLMISSEFGGEMVEVNTPRGVVQKPQCFVKYNELMSVDHNDQMMSYYPVDRTTLKWSKKLGIHVLHLCLVNSFFLYKKKHPKTSLYDFRNSVIKSLLPPPNPNPSSSRPLQRGTKGLSNHFPRQYEIPEGRTKTVSKRCRVCLEKKLRKETCYFCPACEAQPPLCVPCFVEYHKNMEF